MRQKRSRALAEAWAVIGDARDHGHEDVEARRLSETLVGQTIPSVLLTGSMGESVDLGDVATGLAAVYVYPGYRCSPDGGEDSPMLDVTQHRAYNDHENDLSALDILAIAVSSQSWQRQRESAAMTRVRHMFLSDPTLLLAERLGLPTFEDRGVRWYRRLTMAVRHGRINKVFYPVRTPGMDPARVLDWARSESARVAE